MIDIDFSLGATVDLKARFHDWTSTDAVQRLWDRDTTLWREDPTTPELADRLGWLDLPETSMSLIDPLRKLQSEIPFWITDLLLIGMGGASLAPQVIARTIGGEKLPLTLLDTTHPESIRDLDWLAPGNSVFIVASKSGTTIETLSLFQHFWSRAKEVIDNPGSHFIAVTDPDSALADLAEANRFRAVFEAPVDVGGRFSALSPFGLVPSGLVGVDVGSLLTHAAEAREICREPLQDNPGFRLGAALGELAMVGRDKVTFVTSSAWAAFPAWAEQLIAESTGKDDVGIIPIVDEPHFDPATYGSDRVFVGLLAAGEAALEAAQWGEEDHTPARMDALEAAGHPVIRIRMEEPEELGALFFIWEVAVAMAGSVLSINPFDQPSVQLAKELAQKAMSGETAGEDTHPSTELDLGWDQPPFGHALSAIPSEPPVGELRKTMRNFLATVKDGEYIGVQAYMRAEDEEQEDIWARLREALTRVTGVATTLGYGPRFLHSTGQLHKGGPNTGVFLQVMDNVATHLPIPESHYTFRQLVLAQAQGDFNALNRGDRRVLRIRVGPSDGVGLRRLVQLINEVGKEYGIET
jgi:transaldolase/glucose-6-phosphate isomerase